MQDTYMPNNATAGKSKTTRVTILFLVSGLIALGMASCGTMRGFGNDVSHAGNHIEEAAQ